MSDFSARRDDAHRRPTVLDLSDFSARRDDAHRRPAVLDLSDFLARRDDAHRRPVVLDLSDFLARRDDAHRRPVVLDLSDFSARRDDAHRRPTRLTAVTVEPPPEHVLAAFGLTGVLPAPLGDAWEGGWRCGEVVLSMVADNARATWSARVRETLFVDGVRLARPVRSTDGRYVVSGWRADTFVAGTPEARHDEVVSAAVRLHEATGKLERPRFLTQGPTAPWADIDVFIAADRAAWEERPLQSVPPGARTAPPSADAERSVELINQLATLRKPTRSPNQLVHGDLYGTVLFAGTAPPGITDITPYWRPASWAAGVVVVDALSWGEADDGLIERWSALPEWSQMLLRALMFRLAVHALHPRSTAEAFPGLARTAAMVRMIL